MYLYFLNYFPWNFFRHQKHVHSITWKPFKISSWNFIWISINIRRCAECKNHNSCIYAFWVISFGISLVNINVHWMYNTIWHQKRGKHLCFCRKTNSSFTNETSNPYYLPSSVSEMESEMYVNLYNSLGKFSRWKIAPVFFLFFTGNGLWHSMSIVSKKIDSDSPCKLSPLETICIECQSLFFRKNKKNISKCYLLNFLSSMLNIKCILFLLFQKSKV